MRGHGPSAKQDEDLAQPVRVAAELINWRPRSDSNRRMAVLQTAVLDHLTTRPWSEF